MLLVFTCATHIRVNFFVSFVLVVLLVKLAALFSRLVYIGLVYKHFLL